jgi:hypothetical protein
MTWTRVSLVLALVAACGLAACAQKSNTRTLTERERDSTLGKSAIPGGAAVTRALEESDSAAARTRRLNEAASGQ